MAAKFIDSARLQGIAENDDLNGAGQEGAGYVQATQRNGWRCSSYRAFVAPVRRRPNLKVLTRAQVLNIGFVGRRANRVAYAWRGRSQIAHVAGDVILSAGAIASPHILLLSGIGPAEQLRSFDISPVMELRGVGSNLHDHPGLGMTFAVRVPTFNDDMSLPRQVLHGLNWLLFGRGPGATPDAHVIAFIRSGKGVDRPDIQLHFTPAGYLISGAGELLLKQSSVTAIASVCRPKSRGWVRLCSADPLQAPGIQPNLFGERADLDLLIRGVQWVRRIFRSEPLAGYVTDELQPSREIASDQQLENYILHAAGTIYHPCGTCKMGTDSTAVVDANLRVRGLLGLRIADASIMPLVPSGNLNAPCMMIGEKASDLILASSPAAGYAK